jgi:ATP-dependent DNA ligase
MILWDLRAVGEALAVALADLSMQEAIIDGEVVAEGSGGAPDF